MKVNVRVAVETIVRETSCSERSVRRAIRALAALGVLSYRAPEEFAIHVEVLEKLPKVGNRG